MSFRITSVTAFLSVGDDDEEGVIGIQLDGAWFPLVMADEERLRQMRPYAEEVARQTKRPVRLVRFETRTEVEVIGG
jgi:hypothetical protein